MAFAMYGGGKGLHFPNVHGISVGLDAKFCHAFNHPLLSHLYVCVISKSPWQNCSVLDFYGVSTMYQSHMSWFKLRILFSYVY